MASDQQSRALSFLAFLAETFEPAAESLHRCLLSGDLDDTALLAEARAVALFLRLAQQDTATVAAAQDTVDIRGMMNDLIAIQQSLLVLIGDDRNDSALSMKVRELERVAARSAPVLEQIAQLGAAA